MMTGEPDSSRTRNLLSGGLALTALVSVALLWALNAWTGVDLKLFDEGDRPGVAVKEESTSAGWYTLYFTEPEPEPSWSGGLDEVLAADIDRAQRSVDIATYDLDLESVTSALLRAHDRGVAVRMLIESDNIELDQPQELIAAGIPVVQDGRGALMHNKFVVIDGQTTWTGSWNYTDSGTYFNNNNAIRILSAEMAANYTSEFNEMFVDRAFGPNSPAGIPHRRLLLEATRVDTFFAPEDAVMDELVQVVSGAGESIRFMAYSFTDNQLGLAIRERAAAGVLVEGIFESRGATSVYSEFGPMQEAGLNVWPDGNPNIMHHKVIIVDADIVVLGSFNYSQSADRDNDENLLVIYSAEIAARFLDEFDQLITQAYP
jgi:phosphatidylserine/phosphatidylglycerophosphate/cardiolipin synthase-like enzyme